MVGLPPPPQCCPLELHTVFQAKERRQPELMRMILGLEASRNASCHFSQEYVKNDIVIFITGGQLSARCLSFHWLNIAERLSWITSSCAGRIRAHFAAGIG